MKALIAGFSHMKGIAKQSGKPFDMMRLTVLAPVQSSESEKFSKTAVGYEAADLPVAESAKQAFLGLTYPCLAQLEISHEIFAGKMQAVVNGVSNSAQLTPTKSA